MSIIERIKQLFKREVKPVKNAALFKPGGTWGNAIDVTERNALGDIKGHGWKSSKPQEGDMLAMKMESGKIGLFVFVEVQLCKDPADMFFFQAKFWKYNE